MSDNVEKKGYVQGTLAQLPFSKTLLFIHDAKKTGVLAIARAKKKVHIHLLKGEIVYVTSSYFPGYTLGDFLLKQGKITMQVHEESIEKIRGTTMKQGTYLMEKGYISPHDLYTTLIEQITEKLLWMFKWEEGDFFFKEGPVNTDEANLIKIPFPRMIYKGIRDHLPLHSLPTEFKGRKESPLVRVPDLPFNIEELGLGPRENRILSLVNGTHTIRQIVTLSKMKKKSIYRVLYALYTSNIVRFPESIRVQRKPQAPAKSRAAQVRESMEINVADDLIQQALASVDRIKEQVQQDEHQEVEVPVEQPFTMAAEPGFEQVDELSNEGMEKFGFDTNAPDGFSSSDDDEDEGLGFEMTDDAVEVDDEEDAVEVDDYEVAEEEERHEQDASYDVEQDMLGDFEEADEDLSEDDYEEDEVQLSAEDFDSPHDIKDHAIMLMQDGHFDDAARFLKTAHMELPDDSDILAYLGWAIYNSKTVDGDQYAMAEQTIKQGMGANRTNYLHFLYLGRIYFEERQYEFAELHFVKALELNLDCDEARDFIKKIHAK